MFTFVILKLDLIFNWIYNSRLILKQNIKKKWKKQTHSCLDRNYFTLGQPNLVPNEKPCYVFSSDQLKI